MHIAFLTGEYPPLPSGGIGTSIRNLARALVGQGHRVTVLGWGAKAEISDRGVVVRFLGHTSIPRMGWLLNRRLAQHELNRLVRDEGLDVVEAADWCGMSAGLRLACPIVIRCNGTATYFAHLLHEKVRAPVRWAEALALRQADAVVAVSRFTAEQTRRLFRLRRPVGMIPNGVDLAQFQAAPDEEVEADTILYLGTLVRKKGVVDLGQIFSRVVEQRPQARLRLIGRDTADRRTGAASTWELCRATFSSAAWQQVEYLGPQPYERVQDHVRRAAVCVFPSYAEALPLAWLEAMACARPIVAYDIGWAPEVVEDGVTGFLVPPGDLGGFAGAILSVLADRSHAQALGWAGRSRVESRFAAEVVAGESVQWYQRVIKDRS